MDPSDDIREIHVSWGDYSYRYRVGGRFDDPFEGDNVWGKISKIRYNQYLSLGHDKLVYDIYAWDHSDADPKERVAKRIIGLPVELTYHTSKQLPNS